MQQMSPLLQSRIEQLPANNTNSNSNSGAQYIDLQSNPDAIELSAKNKKVIKIVAIVTAIITTIAGLGLLAHNGKLGVKAKSIVDGFLNKFKGSTKLTEPNNEINLGPIDLDFPEIEPVNSADYKFEKGIKQFFNEEKKLINDVELKQGNAVVKNGESINGFTGIMTAIDGKDRKIALRFKDGILQSSTIDGKLKKTYQDYGKVLENTIGQNVEDVVPSGVTIIKNKETGVESVIRKEFGKIESFGQGDDTSGMAKITYFDNGKIIRKHELCNGMDTNHFIEYFSDGKTPKQKVDKLGANSYRQIKYNTDGSVLEEINGNELHFYPQTQEIIVKNI